MSEGAAVLLGGTVAQCRVLPTKRGERMARVRLEDQTGVVDVIAFPEVFSRHAELLSGDRIVIVVGFIDRSRGEVQVLADRVLPIEEAPIHLATRLDLMLDATADDGPSPDATLRMLHGMLKQASSSVAALRGRPVEIGLSIGLGREAVALAPRGMRVVAEPGLLMRLEEMLGSGRVRVRGGFRPQRTRQRRGADPKRGACVRIARDRRASVLRPTPMAVRRRIANGFGPTSAAIGASFGRAVRPRASSHLQSHLLDVAFVRRRIAGRSDRSTVPRPHRPTLPCKTP